MYLPKTALPLLAVIVTLVGARSDAKRSDDHGMRDERAVDITDRYIVTLKGSVDMLEHMAVVQALTAKQVTSRSDEQQFEGVTHQYNISDFQGYAGHFSKSTIDSLKRHKDISVVERDQIWQLASSDQEDQPWVPGDPEEPAQPDEPYHPDGIIAQGGAEYGLDLISQKTVGRRGYFYDSSAGEGTFAYILDSGINIEHAEFQGRANLGYNAVDKRARAWGDNLGHGTHIAGLVGSKTYGVAKKTQLIAVKVVEQSDAVFSQVLDGFQWAVRDMTAKNRKQKAVVHVSVHGPYTAAWESAVKAAFDKGVSTVYPAGNRNLDPTPRLVELSRSAIIVSATGRRREKAAFANYGAAVRLYAPGDGIKSLWGHDGTRTMSGTAQAAAHVSGLIVYFKGLPSVLMPNAVAVRSYVMAKALSDAVIAPQGPKGKFAYNGSGR